MDFLSGFWANVSAIGALIGVLVWNILSVTRGTYVPRKSHERELALERQRAEDWRQTALAYQESNNTLLAQNRTLIESNRITDAFFRSASPQDILEATGGSNA